ncbi:alkaline phosphatase family protein [Flammeovirga sp. SJP92]|uniref:alkaline phosphatase family protein n=1 Tax=Flammeovirga sp. SJP92 TaxID=1775430 RepID=UPI0007874882|nr:alkaline phosphatase family protein [Flammeovirga sp. SJP92]KXX68065.1 hypothetical protein AVL50_23615 [Flammeovirga sp. SJP92]
MKNYTLGLVSLLFILLVSCQPSSESQSIVQKEKERKVVYIIVDGIPNDVVEKVSTPYLDSIAAIGGYTHAYVGGKKGGYSQTPTISAVGYNSLLTGTWVNKHNVYGNGIKAPNYHYTSLFKLAKEQEKPYSTAIYSTWLDNRTKLIGEGLASTGNVKVDYAFDGFELDTVNFPKKENNLQYFEIDEKVSKEAGRYIKEKGPDFSWVYLQYTDDASHRFGDSDYFYEYVTKADTQVGRVWEAVKEREAKFKEEWMIVVTTDHGRTEETGHHHGGQSERERATWIVTNQKPNKYFELGTPGVTSIYPSIVNFMGWNIKEEQREELDDVAFYGATDFFGLDATTNQNTTTITWTPLQDAEAEVLVTTTNNYKTGGSDQYTSLGKVNLKDKSFTFDKLGDFQKIVLKSNNTITNTWTVKEGNQS